MSRALLLGGGPAPGNGRRTVPMQSAYQVPAEERRHLEYWNLVPMGE